MHARSMPCPRPIHTGDGPKPGACRQLCAPARQAACCADAPQPRQTPPTSAQSLSWGCPSQGSGRRAMPAPGKPRFCARALHGRNCGRCCTASGCAPAAALCTLCWQSSLERVTLAYTRCLSTSTLPLLKGLQHRSQRCGRREGHIVAIRYRTLAGERAKLGRQKKRPASYGMSVGSKQTLQNKGACTGLRSLSSPIKIGRRRSAANELPTQLVG